MKDSKIGIEPGVLVDKLNSLETATEIAGFLVSQEVKGRRGKASTCAISQWISEESGRYITTSNKIKVWNGFEKKESYEAFAMSDAVCDFVEMFDQGEFPLLDIDWRSE